MEQGQILAVTSGPVAETAAGEDELRAKKESLGHWGRIHIVPMIFPVVLLMAAGIAEEQLAVATAMVVASFACSSARIIFSEKQRPCRIHKGPRGTVTSS